MIAHLRGTVHKLGIGEVMLDVQGVGYRVAVPLDAWEQLEEAQHASLWTSTYIREDRFDLFGFPDRQGQLLFEELIKMQGVGPKLGLELCAVPRNLLLQAAQEQDGGILKNVKGVGKRTAEKLVVELRALLERHPGIFGAATTGDLRSEYDQDAIAALTSLGYDSSSAVDALKRLPADLKSTEERVAAALRAL
ncbi:MAG: Holliday junction branch migration protein RuvA [Candidatus Peribacteraceae bacterium]|nr:Holliday junction branch migration protein RuvA [Candidatus Peribacteraceae bacterium]